MSSSKPEWTPLRITDCTSFDGRQTGWVSEEPSSRKTAYLLTR